MTFADSRRGLCVLTFHRVVDSCEQDHDLKWGSFLRLLEALPSSDIPIDTKLTSEGSFQERAIVLTFDDGTRDHVRVGEELARRRMQGIFFVPAGKLGTTGHISAQELRHLRTLGHVVGSHGFDHIPLRTPKEIVKELADSKSLLEDVVGTKIFYFAPPGGLSSRLVIRELQAQGYTASRSMNWGIYRSLEDRWHIPCTPVTEFTLARGWVMQTLTTFRIPVAMRAAWVVKLVLPAPLRFGMRRKLHAAFGTRGRKGDERETG